MHVRELATKEEGGLVSVLREHQRGEIRREPASGEKNDEPRKTKYGGRRCNAREGEVPRAVIKREE